MPAIDLIKDQADRYDKSNMQFEQDVIFNINREYSKVKYNIINCGTSCSTLLQMQQMMNVIGKAYNIYTSVVTAILRSKLPVYADKAYNTVGDLIELGREQSGNLSSGVKEQRKLVYSDDMIDIIKNNAFSLITGKTNTQIDQMRREITNLMLAGNATKQNVRDAIRKILDSSDSYAELVAQTELSAVYNMGTIKRLKEYKEVSGHNMKKYWHGFQYSARTCQFCLEHIGGIYDIDDESETLPAHPNCRCTWLPYDEEWDNTARNLITKANMLNTSYSPDMIYDRINTRLNIQYGKYMSQESASDYLAGDRSTKVIDSIRDARGRFIDDTIDSFGIQPDTNMAMSQEFNDQMKFWKKFVASAIADNDRGLLSNSRDAIKGVMLLPWSGEQLDKWNQLLSKTTE